MLTIYHNGECSKSKGALEIIQESGVPHEVRFYLAEPLSEEELERLLAKSGLKAVDIVRKNEPLYQEQYEGKEITEADWINILIENPELIERPIVENDEKAIVARPPERVLEMMK